MDYLFSPIFDTPPATCGITTADCPAHGFGLSKQRGNELIDAIYLHGDLCRNEATASVDFPRFMAGPDSLDLVTPAELLFVGYFMSRVSTALQTWQAAAQAEQILRELDSTVQAQHTRNHDSSPLANWAQNGHLLN